MKNIYNIFYICLLAASMIGFTSCSEDETFDFEGDPYNRVYMNDFSASYKIVQTPISTISALKFKEPLKCTQKATSEIKVTVEVDNSMIAAYNKEHGTNFVEIPASALNIKNSTMTIPAGSMMTKDSIDVQLVDDQQVLSQLSSENAYLIPLRITRAEGGQSQPSTNFYSSFLSVSITNDNVNHDATEADITGTLVADQSGWSATTNGTVDSWGGPIESMFDGDMSNYADISIDEGTLNVDVNMGKPYTFDAITLYYGWSWGSYHNEYSSFEDGMEIFTSNNGTDWVSAGLINNDSKVCVFYAPITAQYIRISKPQGGYYTSISAGIFNVYEK